MKLYSNDKELPWNLLLMGAAIIILQGCNSWDNNSYYSLNDFSKVKKIDVQFLKKKKVHFNEDKNEKIFFESFNDHYSTIKKNFNNLNDIIELENNMSKEIKSILKKNDSSSLKNENYNDKGEIFKEYYQLKEKEDYSELDKNNLTKLSKKIKNYFISNSKDLSEKKKNPIKENNNLENNDNNQSLKILIKKFSKNV